MSDSHQRDDEELANEPNEEGFAGGATMPEAQPENPDAGRAERIAVPGDDLTSALSDAVPGKSDDEEA
ncbi:hypothetical protein [Phytohabitans aurantiacus]|uniref:Uncharacterized protein n=1 Tax=Phytohabitans aurantiacus TaxID=3016789 RepID=A0ABQ5R356_9ACTN|nr:hypothetical protein [Phytohabitans aurantiacus]GLI00971.1 hypothetical protein Pa4123_62470 [Phytohabitans aurantiacus]